MSCACFYCETAALDGSDYCEAHKLLGDRSGGGDD
jgi:hypothetical protein